MKFFLDTYAILEIADGNPSYEEFLDHASTGHTNLLEMHYHLARLKGEETADRALVKWWTFAEAPTQDDIREASRLRTRETKRRLSFIDALGYAMAQHRRLAFVTGDPGFSGLPGVQTPKRI